MGFAKRSTHPDLARCHAARGRAVASSETSTQATGKSRAKTYPPRKLKMPVVTTLHTVLGEPDANQRQVLEEIARLSDRVVVMSEQAAQFLREVYAVPNEKIDIIPHGVPDFQFMDPNYFKDRFGAEGKSVLLTFGLLSPNKGIENVIRALPAILAKHPNVVYIVSGATHPHIRRRDGERYREELQALAAQLGVLITWFSSIDL